MKIKKLNEPLSPEEIKARKIIEQTGLNLADAVVKYTPGKGFINKSKYQEPNRDLIHFPHDEDLEIDGPIDMSAHTITLSSKRYPSVVICFKLGIPMYKDTDDYYDAQKLLTWTDHILFGGNVDFGIDQKYEDPDISSEINETLLSFFEDESLWDAYYSRYDKNYTIDFEGIYENDYSSTIVYIPWGSSTDEIVKIFEETFNPYLIAITNCCEELMPPIRSLNLDDLKQV